MKRKSKEILLADDLENETSKDQSRSQSVKACATALAKKLNSTIHLVHAENMDLYAFSKPYYPQYILDLMKTKKSRIKTSGKAIKAAVRTSLLDGNPIEVITKLASKKDQYELLALGSHGRKGLKRAILGSVAEELVRNSKIPVLILGPYAQKQTQKFFNEKPVRILVATDLGVNSKKAEEYAGSLAKRLSAEVILFYSFSSGLHPMIGTAFTAGSLQGAVQDMMEKMRPGLIQKLEKKAKTFQDQGIRCSFVMDKSPLDTSTAILRLAGKSKSSLIVMGTHGRGLLSGAFLGNHARELILRSSLPLIVVRSR